MMRRSGDGKKPLEVASISGMYVGKDSCTYYQVQWSPSWESKDNVVGCEKLIQEFHSRQEKEIFGGSMITSKQSSVQLDEVKSAISNELCDFRSSVNAKLNKLEELVSEQQKYNEQFSRRLSALEASTYSTNCYYERTPRRQPSSLPETDLGSAQNEDNIIRDNISREKDDENNENNDLFFEDMMYNEYMEGNMEPRRKRNRGPGDIAVGIPVNVDATLLNKIKERLEASDILHKEAEVVHAIRVCNIRHILALKLAQIIFSDEELAAASYAPGNFKPLDDVKLSLIEEFSFLRFATDETEIREVSWGQIHQRIKNKCRCKRKIYNDKLIGTNYNKVTCVTYPGNWSTRDQVSNPPSNKSTMSYSMATRNTFSTPYTRQTYNHENSFETNKTNTTPKVYDLTDSELTQTTSASNEHLQCRSDPSHSSNSATENDSGDITIVFKEDETDYIDDS